MRINLIRNLNMLSVVSNQLMLRFDLYPLIILSKHFPISFIITNLGERHTTCCLVISSIFGLLFCSRLAIIF